MEMVRGTPSIRLRPLISMVSGLSSGIGRADFHFDGFGGALADQQVVLALHELHDGVVHLIAGHAHASASRRCRKAR